MMDTLFKEQTKKEFEKERKEFLDTCYNDAKDPKNLIPAEDLDFYLKELKKHW